MKMLLNQVLPLLVLTGSTVLVGCGTKSTDKEENPAGLELTEIFYNAAGEDSLEFIEFHNPGKEALNLAGVRIQIGDTIAYQFDGSAPELKGGERVVLTNFVALFQARYPGVQVYGPMGGKLNNSGESISAELPDSTNLSDCKYGSNPPWPPMAAGGGFSLVYIGGDCKSSTAWAASSVLGGKPGEEDQPAPALGVSLNEVMPSDIGQSGWIEMVNTTKSEIDISGWILTDSLGKANAMMFAPGTKVPANGFLVVEEADYTGGLYPARTGETLFLIATKAGVPTGAAMGFKYPALALGKTAGEVSLGDGSVQIGPLAEVTKAAENSDLAHGALVFSEIMYHPADGGYEYIEIVNTSTDSVLLADPFDPQRVWKVEGVGFEFPVGASVQGSGKIVLVSKDIAAETFRSQQGIPADVLVFEFDGKLANSSETLTIKEPLVAVAGNMGTTNYANTWSDQVTYMDGGAWPEDADGGGMALIRKNLEASGSDPASWTSGAPTPGK